MTFNGHSREIDLLIMLFFFLIIASETTTKLEKEFCLSKRLMQLFIFSHFSPAYSMLV